NSLGCQTIVDCAARYPGRVSRLILQGPSGDPEGRSAFRLLARFVRQSPREPFSEDFVALTDWWDCGPGRLVRTAHYLLQDRPEDKLPLVRVPTLVVRGERDDIAPQRWVEEVARLVPQGRLVVIPNGVHTLNYAAPPEFIDQVVSFLHEG